MNTQKYDLIWKQIADKLQEVNTTYDISFELINNTFNEFFVEDVNGASNFFSVRPIIKQGRETYGVISCSTENELHTVFYHNYEEFEKVLNRWLGEVFKEKGVSKMINDYIKALREDKGYDWIARHGWELSKDELINIIKEFDYAVEDLCDHVFEDKQIAYDSVALELENYYMDEEM